MLRTLITLVLLGIMHAPALAKSGLKAGVLDLEVRDGGLLERDLAKHVSSKLRSLIRGQRRWQDVGKLSATLTDAKLAFGCDETNTSCMTGLAKTLGVDVLIWGTVDRQGQSVNLRLWGVSNQGATKGIEKGFDRQSLGKRLDLLMRNGHKGLESELRNIGRSLVDALLKRPQRLITFEIRTEPVSAQVRINGSDYGTSPVRVRLNRGVYELELRADGFESQQETIQISSATKPSKTWLLSNPNANEASSRRRSSARQIVRWTALGVGTAALASTAFFYNEASKALGSTQDQLCGQKPSECGGAENQRPTGFVTRAQYADGKADYDVSKGLMTGSIVLTSLAASTFASTFLFEWE